MSEGIEKVYCCDRPNDNSAMWAALMNSNNNPAELMALMNGNNNWNNNPLIWLVFMAMFGRGGWFGNGGDAAVAANSDMNRISAQMSDNQNTNLMMDAINGNHEALHELSTALGVDFATIQGAISQVQNAITQVGGTVGMTGEKVINAVLLGNKDLTAAITSCCCENKQLVQKMGYESQIATLNQTNTLQSRIDQLANGVQQGFSQLGYENQKQTTEIVNAINASQQRTADLLNGHWIAETSQSLQDAKFEISQLKQNQAIVAALKSGCGCNCNCN